MRRSKSRTLYATPEEWSRIRDRAEEARMTTSRFVVECCLHDEAQGTLATREEQPSVEGLALSEVAQRELHEAARRLDACCRVLLEPAPGASMSVLDALAFVRQCHARLQRERDAVLRQDGEWAG